MRFTIDAHGKRWDDSPMEMVCWVKLGPEEGMSASAEVTEEDEDDKSKFAVRIFYKANWPGGDMLPEAKPVVYKVAAAYGLEQAFVDSCHAREKIRREFSAYLAICTVRRLRAFERQVGIEVMITIIPGHDDTDVMISRGG